MLLIIRALAVLALGLLAGAAQAQSSGGYFGVDAAEGMRLTLDRRGDGATGALVGPDGLSRPFTARPAGEGLEAMLDGPEGRTLLRILPAPAGARVVLAPVSPEGVMDAARMTALAFLPDGTPLPKRPERFLPAPAGPVAAFDARAFVDSYPFWEAQGMAYAYEGVAGRYRTVMGFFPLAHADVLGRLCAARERPAAMADAMRGQGVTCDSLTATLARIRGGGRAARFEAAVSEERSLLLTALGCADDLLRRRPECARVSDETARRAVSLETVASALARYR